MYAEEKKNKQVNKDRERNSTRKNREGERRHKVHVHIKSVVTERVKATKAKLSEWKYFKSIKTELNRTEPEPTEKIKSMHLYKHSN